MKRIFTLCLFLCCASDAWADGSIFPTTPASAKKTYFSVGTGILYPTIGHNNSIPTGAGWPNDFYGRKATASNEPYLLLATGYAWERPTTWLPVYSLGLRYTYAAPSTASGYINQYSEPNFRNYNYSYHIQQQTILGVVKADLIRWNNILPYLMLGAGWSINNVSDYEEQAVPNVTPRVSPGFGGKYNTNFTYTAGIGIDYALLNNVWINLEYNYSHIGTIKTGTGANTTSLTDSNYSGQLLKNNLTTNALLLGVTYFIG
jgi:opacity protein-like surface antigen